MTRSGCVAMEGGKGIGAIHDSHDLVAGLFQVKAHRARELGLVFDQKHFFSQL